MVKPFFVFWSFYFCPFTTFQIAAGSLQNRSRRYFEFTENGFEPKSVREVVIAVRCGRFIFDIFPMLLNYSKAQSHFIIK
jgi:hypothetical protein